MTVIVIGECVVNGNGLVVTMIKTRVLLLLKILRVLWLLSFALSEIFPQQRETLSDVAHLLAVITVILVVG